MSEILLSAQSRGTGKKAVNAVRNTGAVPGIYYMNGEPALPIAVLPLAMRPIVYTAESHVIHLEIDGNAPLDCILKAISFDPVTDKIVHFDLQGLSKDKTIVVEVPVMVKGIAIGTRDGGLVQISLHKIAVECLPADIPEHIDLDITNCKIGGAIHIGDLKVEGLKFIGNTNAVIVAVLPPTVEKAVKGATEPEVVSTKGSKKADD